MTALQRHIEAWRKGEDFDQESGELHLASVAWCAFTLIEYFFFRQQMDDRARLWDEEWRPSPDPRWEVSSLGKVCNAKTKQVRKLSVQSMGYSCFNHRLPNDAGWKLVLVHRWVATAFWGPLQDGDIVNHRDGNKLNNAVWNLEITDQRGNMVHSRRANPEFWEEHNRKFGERLGGKA